MVSVVTLETRVPRALPSFGRENFVIGSSGDQWVKFRIGGCVSHSWQIPCPLPPHPTSHLSRTTRGVAEVELQSRTQRRERKRTGTCRLSSSNKMRPIWLYSITFVTSHWISQLRVCWIPFTPSIITVCTHTQTTFKKKKKKRGRNIIWKGKKKWNKDGNTVDDLATVSNYGNY